MKEKTDCDFHQEELRVELLHLRASGRLLNCFPCDHDEWMDGPCDKSFLFQMTPHIMAKLIVNLVAALGYMITFLLCTYSVGQLADVSPWLAVVSGL